MSATDRAALAELWTDAALAEHASVGSFAELVCDLLALAAPPELIRDALAAAADEVEHARLCFGLAAAYRGESVGPGPLNAGPIRAPTTYVDFARRNARDACVNETLALVLLAEQRERATDPAVRAVLGRVIDDETRHAELAFRIARWAIEVGGVEVERVTADELSNAPPYASASTTSEVTPLERHGHLSARARAHALHRGYLEVIEPLASGLRQIASPPTALAVVA